MSFLMKISALAAILLAGCEVAPASDFASTVPGELAFEEDGLFIRTFFDGSGSVALGPGVRDFRWSIDCRVDAMTDRRNCSIDSGSDGLFIHYGTAAQPRSVCILGHDFPGRTGMIRVEGNSPIATDTDGCVGASAILSQIMTGTTVVTRRVEWPYDYSVDATTTLRGFTKAMDVVARIRAGSI